MRRKVEDELIRLAFGDIEPGQSAYAKRALAEDAKAAKLLAGYAELREGLKQLKTPDHQLSTERLRERILAEGLKPAKPAPLTWRWALGPAAVAVAAMLITLRLSGPSSVPGAGYAGLANPDLAGLSATSLEWAPRANVLDQIIKGAAEGAVSDAPLPGPVEASTLSSKPHPSGALAVHSEPAGKHPAVKGMTPQEMSSLALDGALPAGAVALHQEASGDEPIVLIGAESDETTGANRATEVSSATNVVVGG